MRHLTKLAILTVIGSLIGAVFYFEYSGNKVTEPALAQTEQTQVVAPTEVKEKIYTKADFDGHGRSGEKNRQSDIVHVEINPSLSPFTFLVNSFTENSRGQIIIYHNSSPEPIQIINLEDPDMRMTNEIHSFFNATDINFDGYLDIGVLIDGGAKWGSYQYWIFDKNTNTFITTEFTKDFRKMSFNKITFDETKKQITINNFCGTLICFKDIYEVQDDGLVLLEEYEEDQPYTDNGEIIKKCTTTITKHHGSKSMVTTETTEDFCTGYYEA